MKESEVIKKIRENLIKDINIHYFKIPDMPIFTGAKYRFGIPKPYDFYVIKNGIFNAYEVKVVNTKKTIRRDLLKWHQEENLEEVIRAGGKAFILIYFNVWQELYEISADDWIDFTKEIKDFDTNISFDSFKLKARKIEKWNLTIK